jgi:hypothetical protein
VQQRRQPEGQPDVEVAALAPPPAADVEERVLEAGVVAVVVAAVGAAAEHRAR